MSGATIAVTGPTFNPTTVPIWTATSGTIGAPTRMLTRTPERPAQGARQVIRKATPGECPALAGAPQAIGTTIPGRFRATLPRVTALSEGPSGAGDPYRTAP